MSIKISCIIPYYNVEKEYLRQCIDSILRQDFQDYEIILVDDGSEENFSEYLKELKGLDSRIKVTHQQNQGVSTARNNGVKQAVGDYITFVDADDVVLPFFFSEAYRMAAKNNAEYVVGCVQSLKIGEKEVAHSSAPKLEVRDSDQYRASLIMITDRIQNGGYFGRGPVARLIKRTIAEQVMFPVNVKLGEDIIWNLDVVSKCNKIYMVYQIWYLYRQHSNSVSYRYNADIVPTCEQHLKELIKRIDRNDKNELIAYGNHIYELLRHNIFRCYLGRDECQLPTIKKFRLYHDLSKKDPWAWHRTDYFIGHCGIRLRIKQMLMHTGLLYWYCVLKNRSEKNI